MSMIDTIVTYPVDQDARHNHVEHIEQRTPSYSGKKDHGSIR